MVLDQGEVSNPFGKEKICELEFELKEGELSDIFSLMTQMPKFDGMWLSSLSKAQRGYLVGKPERFKAEILQAVKNTPSYTLEQQLVDYLRLYQDEEIYTIFYQIFPEFPKFEQGDLREYLKSETYLNRNLVFLKNIV